MGESGGGGEESRKKRSRSMSVFNYLILVWSKTYFWRGITAVKGFPNIEHQLAPETRVFVSGFLINGSRLSFRLFCFSSFHLFYSRFLFLLLFFFLSLLPHAMKLFIFDLMVNSMYFVAHKTQLYC